MPMRKFMAPGAKSGGGMRKSMSPGAAGRKSTAAVSRKSAAPKAAAAHSRSSSPSDGRKSVSGSPGARRSVSTSGARRSVSPGGRPSVRAGAPKAKPKPKRVSALTMEEQLGKAVATGLKRKRVKKRVGNKDVEVEVDDEEDLDDEELWRCIDCVLGADSAGKSRRMPPGTIPCKDSKARRTLRNYPSCVTPAARAFCPLWVSAEKWLGSQAKTFCVRKLAFV